MDGPHNRKADGPRRLNDKQLDQIRVNRTPPPHLDSLGNLLTEVVGAQEKEAPSSTGRRVFESIQAFVDDAFREACTFHSATGGEVVILVENPDFVYHMRVAWHFALKEHLERSCPGKTIRKITFRPGRGGARFVSPSE